MKAEAVIEVAKALVAVGVETKHDLLRLGHNESTCAAWTGVHGQGSGISFVYGRMLAGEDDVKPDRMVQRFVCSILKTEGLDPYRTRALVRGAWNILHEDYPGLTLVALDSAIWRYLAN